MCAIAGVTQFSARRVVVRTFLRRFKHLPYSINKCLNLQLRNKVLCLRYRASRNYNFRAPKEAALREENKALPGKGCAAW